MNGPVQGTEGKTGFTFFLNNLKSNECWIVEPWIYGCEFNIQSLCDVTGLSTRQVESAKKNSIVREKLNDMRTGKRGNYKK